MKHTTIKLSVALSLALAATACRGERSPWAHYGAVHDKVIAVDTVGSQPLDKPPVPASATAKATSPATAKTTSAARTSAPAESPEPAIDRDAKLGVKRLVIAHGVKGREPVKPAAAFSSEAERIYAFVEVSNPERANSAVFVSFMPEGGKERGSVKLRVGEGSRWRTWAYTRLAKSEGAWTAIVRDANGALLAKAPFEVQAAGGLAEAAPKAEPKDPAEAAAKLDDKAKVDAGKSDPPAKTNSKAKSDSPYDIWER